MQDTEKYLFDLNGYLLVKNALSTQEVLALNRVVDQHRIGELLDSAQYFHTGFPGEMIGNQDPSKGPVDVENGSLLDWGPEIRDLIDHPRIIPYLRELLPPGFRLDHSYGVFARKGARTQVGLALHHGGTPYVPSQAYHFAEGRMHTGQLGVFFALTAAAPDAGGFCVIPGSHKANFPLPDAMRGVGAGWPVQQVAVEPGDAVIFTEASTHGTMPWRGENDRKVLFFKYCPGHVQWEPASPGVVVDDRFTERQRSMLRGPFASGRSDSGQV
ncbi:hypothetical protein BBK82_30460 [Lentzea guizhouensis]|uniref:Mitomycin antibiotics/polyketide fumonisin biosynthesis protein n=1 Tax=Lentzea guizhouensis TaxID=1586287 RepID=A0A1B2HPS3_9PSEU|nr:phytanoyl-CoA dioxygenase family protein [Lentzea guizhouensis]ANZ39724.1 hypothetical protein BBK82_30460 [Lentzea guizhouensis]